MTQMTRIFLDFLCGFAALREPTFRQTEHSVSRKAAKPQRKRKEECVTDNADSIGISIFRSPVNPRHLRHLRLSEIATTSLRAARRTRFSLRPSASFA